MNTHKSLAKEVVEKVLQRNRTYAVSPGPDIQTRYITPTTYPVCCLHWYVLLFKAVYWTWQWTQSDISYVCLFLS